MNSQNAKDVKKLIFTSGASFTGTTMLGLILANQPKGFAAGEVYSIFKRSKYPTLPSHLSNNKLWQQLHANEPKDLYPTLFKHYNVVTDSSKYIRWITKISKYLKDDYQIYHILTYKDPLNAYHSFFNRRHKDFKRFYRMYSTYYKTYKQRFNIKAWLKWEDFLLKPSAEIKFLCDLLNIKYKKRKEHYWLNKDLCHVRGASKVSKVIDGRLKPKVYKQINWNPKFNISEAEKMIADHDWSFLGE